MSKRSKLLLGIFTALLLLGGGGGLYFYHRLFSAPGGDAMVRTFIVAKDEHYDNAVGKLRSEGFIRSVKGFEFAFAAHGGLTVAPGGYAMSRAVNAWEIARILSSEPSLKWVVIPEGLRKEEIADILADELGWSNEQKNGWIKKDTAARPEYSEGVYFPDSYLIPKDEPPQKVAERFQAHFQEVFAPYAAEARAQNIKWDTALKIASLVEREAAGADDMPLIAGILWNRLLKGMRLEIDATVQYARGKTDRGWWSPISVADKKINSPYNTYRVKGLPPHPIANPGSKAIAAVLHAIDTDCLYYLHDRMRVIHCAKTYEEHKKNIERYLRS